MADDALVKEAFPLGTILAELVTAITEAQKVLDQQTGQRYAIPRVELEYRAVFAYDTKANKIGILNSARQQSSGETMSVVRLELIAVPTPPKG